MCKEDIRISRKKESYPGNALALTGANQNLFGADANRVSIAVSGQFNPTSNPDATAVICQENQRDTVLAVLSPSHPHVVLRIEEFGPVILGPIGVYGGNTSDEPIWGLATRFNQELADV